jgi:hypothetical protein
MLVAMHPDVSKVVERFGRVHHYVDYRPYRDNPLILRKDAPTPVDYKLTLKPFSRVP